MVHRSDDGNRFALAFLYGDCDLRTGYQAARFQQFRKLLFELNLRQSSGMKPRRKQRNGDGTQFADAHLTTQLVHVEHFNGEQIARSDDVFSLTDVGSLGELPQAAVGFVGGHQLFLRAGERSTCEHKQNQPGTLADRLPPYRQACRPHGERRPRRHYTGRREISGGMLRIRQWLRLIPGYPADYADLGRRESSQQQEQQSVRRNVQVEVHHTVRQDSAAGNQRAHLQRCQQPTSTVCPAQLTASVTAVQLDVSRTRVFSPSQG